MEAIKSWPCRAFRVATGRSQALGVGSQSACILLSADLNELIVKLEHFDAIRRRLRNEDEKNCGTIPNIA